MAIDAATAELLADHRERMLEAAASCGLELDGSAFVFSREPGGTSPWRPDSVTRSFNRVRDRAGLGRVRLHDLRHFVATHLLSAGVDVRTVAGRLGHRNAATTLNVYAAFRQSADRAAADVIGGVLNPREENPPMSERFRPTDAFVDESRRGRRYLMGCVLAQAKDLPSIRATVESLPTRGRRLHFNNEDDGQRRRLLAVLAELPIRAFVVVCQRSHGVSVAAAREACLAAIVTEVQARGVGRLVVESREDDRDDAATILRTRSQLSSFVFEHRTPDLELVLGIADAITWAVGAGGTWRELVEPVVDRVEQVRP